MHFSDVFLTWMRTIMQVTRHTVIDSTYQVAVVLLVKKYIKMIYKLLYIFSFDIKSIQSTCQV